MMMMMMMMMMMKIQEEICYGVSEKVKNPSYPSQSYPTKGKDKRK
jgi:hypothetical protein